MHTGFRSADRASEPLLSAWLLMLLGIGLIGWASVYILDMIPLVSSD
jgi:hypothetical protein